MFELSKLFGSVDRVKLIRLFLSHGGIVLDAENIIKKTKIKSENLRKEFQVLEKAGLIIKTKSKAARVNGFVLDSNFRFIKALSALMFDFQSASRDALKDRFSEVGRAKLLMLSGVFTGDSKARCDILYVGEGIRKNTVDKLVSEFEAEIGYPLRIEVLDLEEFNYRYKMFDRYIRDAVHTDVSEFLINKINI